MRLSIIAIALALAVTSIPRGAAAESSYYLRKGTFAMGGGFNLPAVDTDEFFNSSGVFHMAGGRHLNPATTIQVEWNHNWLAIAPEVLDRANSDSLQFDNAHSSMWSITLNLLRRINPEGEIVPWIGGGAGYYKRNILITQNALVYYPPIWDPWWGWIGGGWVPGEAVTGERSDSGFGFNVGLGIDMSIEGGASLFVDARYHHAAMPGVDMDIIPITFGVRW